jgi:hypothetical protein
VGLGEGSTYAQPNPPSEDASPAPSSSYPSHAGAPDHELFAATLCCLFTPQLAQFSRNTDTRSWRGLGGG